MAVMPTLAREPGGPLTPHHPHSFIRLGHILTPGTATPGHGHYQPRHPPHVIVGSVHVDLLRSRSRRWYMYVDLLRGTVVRVSCFEAKAGPLPEAGLWFWLGVMAVFDSAEDPEYYNVMITLGLLEHTTGTPIVAYRLHHPPQPCVRRPYGRHHHPALSIPKERACDIPLGKLC